MNSRIEFTGTLAPTTNASGPDAIGATETNFSGS